MITTANQLKNVKRLRVYTTESGHVKCEDMDTGQKVGVSGFTIDYDCQRDGPKLRGAIRVLDLELVPGTLGIYRQPCLPFRELLLDAIRERWYRIRHRIRRLDAVEAR